MVDIARMIYRQYDFGTIIRMKALNILELIRLQHCAACSAGASQNLLQNWSRSSECSRTADIQTPFHASLCRSSD
jgi:hypothetical protein